MNEKETYCNKVINKIMKNTQPNIITLLKDKGVVNIKLLYRVLILIYFLGVIVIIHLIFQQTRLMYWKLFINICHGH